jgi:hypothetical protein
VGFGAHELRPPHCIRPRYNQLSVVHRSRIYIGSDWGLRDGRNHKASQSTARIHQPVRHGTAAGAQSFDMEGDCQGSIPRDSTQSEAQEYHGALITMVHPIVLSEI